MSMNKNKCGRIKVYCRVKPTSPERVPIEYTLSNRFKDGKIRMNLKNKNIKPENSVYKFHDVFPSTCSQFMVFESVAVPMIDKFVQKGENCTIFSYGQTGSGKTYTICGSKLIKNRGIIHHTIDQVFDLTHASRSEYEINVSFVEIHNGNIRDLATPRELKNKMEPHRILVKNKSDAMKFFEEVKLKRKTSATNQNEHSSRSHFICTIYLHKKNDRSFDAQFKLVDLAGSEEHSLVNSSESNQIEALAIKKSLYHLKNITRNLANPRFKGIIPYRDSKLTYELRSTLEGKCHIAMIANIDSNDLQTKELINTLEYAREVGSIKKCPVKTLNCAPSFEMRDTQLLKIENENLRIKMSDYSSLKTKYENVIQEISLIKTKYESAIQEISSIKTKYESAVQEISYLKMKNENDTINYLQEIPLLKEQDKNVLGRKSCEIQDTSKYIGSGDASTIRKCLSEQQKDQICVVKEAFEINSASTLLTESSVMHKDNKNLATKLNEEELILCIINIRPDHVPIFGDKTREEKGVGEQPSDYVMMFENVELLGADDTCEEWLHDWSCYHRTRCGLHSGEAAACGFCEHGLKPEQEPSSPWFFHYVGRRKRIAERQCTGLTGQMRVRFVVERIATATAVKETSDERPAPVTGPFGRDTHKAIRCPRSSPDGREDAAVCVLCDDDKIREPADKDGRDDGCRLYVNYVQKIDGFPDNVSLAAGPSSLGTAKATEPTAACPTYSEAVWQRPRAEDSGSPAEKSEPLSKKSEPLSKKSESQAKRPEPLAKKSEPLAKKSEPLAKRSGPLARKSESLAKRSEPLAKTSKPLLKKSEPQVKNNGPLTKNNAPPAKNNAPRVKITGPRKTTKQTQLKVDAINPVEYYENLFNSMEVPDTYTMLKY